VGSCGIVATWHSTLRFDRNALGQRQHLLGGAAAALWGDNKSSVRNRPGEPSPCALQGALACSARTTALPYDRFVRTVAETPIFQRYAALVWSDVERDNFINWIAANPEAGDLIRGSGGCRKVR
jgi:hypothetical protein